MKTGKLLFLVLILTILFIGCKKEEVDNYDYSVSVDETFTIEIEANHTTGYIWFWVNKANVSIVDTLSLVYITDSVGTGVGGTEFWEFKGLSTGIDSLKFEYKRAWNPEGEAADTKAFSVEVK
ncbi:protease inhibitor I42 family protein [Bacteroidota bacterium]